MYKNIFLFVFFDEEYDIEVFFCVVKILVDDDVKVIVMYVFEVILVYVILYVFVEVLIMVCEEVEGCFEEMVNKLSGFQRVFIFGNVVYEIFEYVKIYDVDCIIFVLYRSGFGDYFIGLMVVRVVWYFFLVVYVIC